MRVWSENGQNVCNILRSKRSHMKSFLRILPAKPPPAWSIFFLSLQFARDRNAEKVLRTGTPARQAMFVKNSLRIYGVESLTCQWLSLVEDYYKRQFWRKPRVCSAFYLCGSLAAKWGLRLALLCVARIWSLLSLPYFLIKSPLTSMTKIHGECATINLNSVPFENKARCRDENFHY